MTIGKHSNFASTGSNITADVTIGNYTSIAPYVQMHSIINHACIENRELVSSQQLKGYPQPTIKNKIVIGNDVWIGQNVTILGSVNIGDGAIIGAFSVIAKDVEPYSIVVGNPQIVKNYRFSEKTIEKLLKIQWWNWSDEAIAKANMMNIDSFLDQYPI